MWSVIRDCVQYLPGSFSWHSSSPYTNAGLVLTTTKAVSARRLQIKGLSLIGFFILVANIEYNIQ